jgi:hypothetical protein
MACQLERPDEEQECVDRAIEGTCSIAPSHHISSNVVNSANVAESLHQLGRSTQALELLRFGLAHVLEVGLGLDYLRRLVQVATSLGAASLLPDFLEVADQVEDLRERAEALLGIAYAIARSGDNSLALESLPSVLAAIQALDADETLILEFGSMLEELLQVDSKSLSDLIRTAFEGARSKDRPTVLHWIAALLPVFARADPRLASTVWSKIQQVETMFGSEDSG